MIHQSRKIVAFIAKTVLFYTQNFIEKLKKKCYNYKNDIEYQ